MIRAGVVKVRFTPHEKSLWLEKLCEGNYRRLLRLFPDLATMEPMNRAMATIHGKPLLYLRLIEKSRYTLLVELTHDFLMQEAPEPLSEPAVRIQVCMDARTVEMLGDCVRPGVHEVFRRAGHPGSVLDYKWSLNYFLYRWLEHCIASKYRFRCKGEGELELIPTAA